MPHVPIIWRIWDTLLLGLFMSQPLENDNKHSRTQTIMGQKQEQVARRKNILYLNERKTDLEMLDRKSQH